MKVPANFKHTICLDFDGVCNTYNGWKGEDFLFEPRPGLFEFILVLQENNRRIAIFSVRPAKKLEDWFITNFKDPAKALISTGDLFFPDKKPPADVYIDDRAITFRGSFVDIIEETLNFRAFWEKQNAS